MDERELAFLNDVDFSKVFDRDDAQTPGNGAVNPDDVSDELLAAYKEWGEAESAFRKARADKNTTPEQLELLRGKAILAYQIVKKARSGSKPANLAEVSSDPRSLPVIGRGRFALRGVETRTVALALEIRTNESHDWDRLELRQPHESQGRGLLRGYAVRFNSYSNDLGGFKERVLPGAFSRAIREGQDVKFLVNHDPSLILGRTKSGTLRLAEDNLGLQIECDLPDTQPARDLRESVLRGDISQMSFSFKAVGERWGNDGKIATRDLSDCDLFDVSAVTYPAYEQTSVYARSLEPLGVRVISPSEIYKKNSKGVIETKIEGAGWTGWDDNTKRYFVTEVEKAKQVLEHAKCLCAKEPTRSNQIAVEAAQDRLALAVEALARRS